MVVYRRPSRRWTHPRIAAVAAQMTRYMRLTGRAAIEKGPRTLKTERRQHANYVPTLLISAVSQPSSRLFRKSVPVVRRAAAVNVCAHNIVFFRRRCHRARQITHVPDCQRTDHPSGESNVGKCSAITLKACGGLAFVSFFHRALSFLCL